MMAARMAGCISIDIALPADREGIIEVINSVAREGVYLQTDRYCPTPLWEQALQEGFNPAAGILLLAARGQGRVVGYGRLTPDLETPFLLPAGNIGLCLLPEYRSHGVGAIILNELVSWAPALGYQDLTANILSSNHRSRRLFAKFGFSEINRRELFLPHRGESATEILFGKCGMIGICREEPLKLGISHGDSQRGKMGRDPQGRTA